jgi:hypothetical protein
MLACLMTREGIETGLPGDSEEAPVAKKESTKESNGEQLGMECTNGQKGIDTF